MARIEGVSRGTEPLRRFNPKPRIRSSKISNVTINSFPLERLPSEDVEKHADAGNRLREFKFPRRANRGGAEIVIGNAYGDVVTTVALPQMGNGVGKETDDSEDGTPLASPVAWHHIPL